MPPLLAIATCVDYPSLLEDDRPFVAALAAHGIDVEPAVWNAEVDWRRFDGVLIRSTWDYFRHIERFRTWLDDIESLGRPFWNPPSLVRWNLDKRYLRELEARGVRTAPTLWLEPNGAAHGDAAARILETGWDDVVVKPVVSGGAWRTLRLSRDEVPGRRREFDEMLASGGFLAQPFLPEIVADGELSLLFFGGEFSHAVRKRAKPGDFRVQWTHGGTHVAETVSPSLVDEARRVLAAAPSSGLYARVDGIVRDGHLVLMELEQIEPYLFFAQSTDGAQRFAATIRDAVR